MAALVYTPTGWVEDTTDVTAARMSNIEGGIVQATDLLNSRAGLVGLPRLICRAIMFSGAVQAAGYWFMARNGTAVANGGQFIGVAAPEEFSFDRAAAVAATPTGKKPQLVHRRWAAANYTAPAITVGMGACTFSSAGVNSLTLTRTIVAGTTTEATCTSPAANGVSALAESVEDLPAGFNGPMMPYMHKTAAGAANHLRTDTLEIWLRYVDA